MRQSHPRGTLANNPIGAKAYRAKEKKLLSAGRLGGVGEPKSFSRALESNVRKNPTPTIMSALKRRLHIDLDQATAEFARPAFLRDRSLSSKGFERH
jgi:hypothetical protein